MSSRSAQACSKVSRREFGCSAMLAWLSAMASDERTSDSAHAGVGSSPAGQWRADFPVLNQSVNGQPLAYLDSAATTHRPRQVLATINSFYEHDNANPGNTLHCLARRAYERYEDARLTVATFL